VAIFSDRMNGIKRIYGICVAVMLAACAAVAAPPASPADPRPAPPGGSSVASAVVVIDPGHPSENGHGATSRRGTIESHITLAVGKQLEAILRQRGIRVVMTRTQVNQVVTNRERAEIANRASADVLIRLHCDARAAAGTATYYPDRQGTVDGVTGPSRDVIVRSEALARVFHPAMIAAMGAGWGNIGILGDSKTAVGAEQGALTGSIYSRVPAITVEMVSLANQADDAFVASTAGQDRLARALAAGIEAYLASRARR
jgi:N-acetylmuramoyl-L-alanine amidase